MAVEIVAFLLDQCLRIAEPYVGSVRQTRDTDQVRERLRLRVQKHLDNEIGTELRHAKTPQRASADVLRVMPSASVLLNNDMTSGLSSGIVCASRCVISSSATDHGRIIVSENIEL